MGFGKINEILNYLSIVFDYRFQILIVQEIYRIRKYIWMEFYGKSNFSRVMSWL